MKNQTASNPKERAQAVFDLQGTDRVAQITQLYLRGLIYADPLPQDSPDRFAKEEDAMQLVAVGLLPR